MVGKQTKFLNKQLITLPANKNLLTNLVGFVKFWSRKDNKIKVTFHNTHCPLKSWNTTTPNFWTICIKQYKSIDKGNKRSSKEAKKPYNNYHLQQIDSYNQWREPIQKSRSFLIRAPYVTISFNDTGFLFSAKQQFYQVARRHPNSLPIKVDQWHSFTKYSLP